MILYLALAASLLGTVSLISGLRMGKPSKKGIVTLKAGKSANLGGVPIRLTDIEKIDDANGADKERVGISVEGKEVLYLLKNEQIQIGNALWKLTEITKKRRGGRLTFQKV